MKQLDAARQMAARSGWAVTLLFILHRLLSAVSGGRASIVPYALVAQPIGKGAYAAVRDDPSTVIHQADAQDPLASALPRPPAINQQRWARGAVCHLATVKGAFAGTIWIQRGAYDEDEVRCRYVLSDPGTCVWDFDVYVEPRFRLGRTMGRLWKAVDQELFQQGVRWSFSRISLFNAESLQTHARLGAVRTGYAVFLVMGALQVAWISRKAGLTASWAAASAPSIVLLPPE